MSVVPEPSPASSETTCDRLGAVTLHQHRRGYRFTLDSPLLADFALEQAVDSPERPLRAVDLGTGCGIIALLLKRRRPAWDLAGLELQPPLALLARRNAAENGLDVTVIDGDLRRPPAALLALRPVGLLVANPPYFDARAGRESPSDEKAIARHDHHAPPDALARCARQLLAGNGRLCLCYPAARLTVLLNALHENGLGPTRLRFVHPRAESPAGLVLLEARPDSRRPLEVAAPLVVHAEDGRFTEEVSRKLAAFDATARPDTPSA